tara:strand:- start:5615 stop:5872 length:258 start_codon:yes stop_codon:yes gene_type:complete
MPDQKTIDEGSTRWSNKVLAFIFISLLFGSNILNSYINTQYHHGLQIVDNDKAQGRRLEHAVEKQDFKNDIKDLERELKDCTNGN